MSTVASQRKTNALFQENYVHERRSRLTTADQA